VVVSDTDRQAVADLLERFRAAWARLDATAALDCFDQSPGTVVIGTDEPEFWRSFQDLIRPFEAMTTAFERAEYRYGEGDPLIEIIGDAAWAAGMLHGSFDTADGRIQLPMRMTAVMRRTGDGRWIIRNAHFSVAAAEPVDY
jgi:ketosteroid isomerase-like protein